MKIVGNGACGPTCAVFVTLQGTDTAVFGG
jgi:hypothetical protein